MKKLACLLGLSLLAVSVKAQQSVKFQIKYLPNHVYKMNTKTDMSMEMAMPTDPAVKSKSGAPKSFQQTATNVMQSMISTGVPKADHSFPIKMQITALTTKAKMNGKEIDLPQNKKNPIVGEVITGQCDADGKLHMDQPKTTDSKDAVRAGVTNMINKMQGQIKFPAKSLAVGESFTQDTPINMPAAGMNMDMNAKSTYKLTAIKGNLAYFDTKVSMTIGVDDPKKASAIKGSGSGTGKFVYNIAENNFNTMNNNMDMQYSMNMGGKDMAVKMKIISTVKNDISK